MAYQSIYLSMSFLHLYIFLSLSTLLLLGRRCELVSAGTAAEWMGTGGNWVVLVLGGWVVVGWLTWLKLVDWWCLIDLLIDLVRVFVVKSV